MLKVRIVQALSVCLSMAGALRGQNAVAALKNDYGGAHALCKVKVDGLHASTDLVGRPSEVHILDGAISRGSARFVHGGRDVSIPAGRTVRVMRIEQADTAKYDVLRVTVDAAGMVLPIAFLEPSGTLAHMTEAQLQSLMGQILEPLATSATSPANAGRAAVEPAAAPVRQSEPRPAQPNGVAPSRTSLPSENVLELDAILKRHNGDAILMIEGVHAVMQSPDYTRDNVIVDGVFQPRPAGGIYRGMRDMVLWPNSHVTFLQLSALTEDEHDVLHLVVRSDLGAFAPISFLLPKGQLSALSKLKIMQLMQPFIAFAAADANTFKAEPKTTSASVSNASPAAGTSLQASHPPMQGCAWVRFVSKKHGLELLVQRCQSGNQWVFGDTAEGIGMRIGMNYPLQTQIEVHEKPATQPIEAAIRQQIIAKFTDSQARASCRAVRAQNEEQPGWHEYQVEPFGAYAHPKPVKNEDMEKGDGLCNGMWGADVSSVIIYNPGVSETHFFALYGLSDPIKEQAYDIFSLRFLKP
jgi:hypothetical protein